jgi:hypothetical protein
MKRLILAGSLLVWSATAGLADGLYWVVGNRATGKCHIVTKNPVVIGDIWFSDGPYTSSGDANLARSTISECPKPDPKEAEAEAAADK